VLLKRYGVIFHRLLARESLAPPWRDLLRVYRRLEARGEIRGGRFVAGMAGEQFALPEAVARLRAARRAAPAGELVSISAADPLNLTGIVTPEARVPALASNRVLFYDGVPVAVREARETRHLAEPGAIAKHEIERALVRKRVSPALRAYLGTAG
jgi:ATP-dependent Lhr-like helicase